MADDLSGMPVSWSSTEALSQQLPRQVRRAGRPETVVGIMRGGMIPAVVIPQQLGVRDTRTIAVPHTSSDGADAAWREVCPC